MFINTLEGIEKILVILIGISGRAVLRKNAKKAVKRIKEEFFNQIRVSKN